MSFLQVYTLVQECDDGQCLSSLPKTNLVTDENTCTVGGVWRTGERIMSDRVYGAQLVPVKFVSHDVSRRTASMEGF
jgi:hypothetical protein